MELRAVSLIRKRHKPVNRIASGHDNGEQMRELRKLQRNLAGRIRKVRRSAPYSQPNKTA